MLLVESRGDLAVRSCRGTTSDWARLTGRAGWSSWRQSSRGATTSRRRPLPATRDALHAEEALRHLRRLPAVARLLAAGHGRDAGGPGRSGLAGQAVASSGRTPSTCPWSRWRRARLPRPRSSKAVCSTRSPAERAVSPADVMFDIAAGRQAADVLPDLGSGERGRVHLERILKSPATWSASPTVARTCRPSPAATTRATSSSTGYATRAASRSRRAWPR